MGDNWRNRFGVGSNSKSSSTIDKLKRELESSMASKAVNSNYNRFHTAIATSNTHNQNSSGPTHATHNRDRRRDNQAGPSRPRNEFKTDKAPKRDPRVEKFLKSTPSLESMFTSSARKTTTNEESKMFMKLAGKFSKDSLDTNQFSEEYDDSQAILAKSKRFKSDFDGVSNQHSHRETEPNQETCDRCLVHQPEHLMLDKIDNIYMTLLAMKPILDTTISDTIIRSGDHSCDSYLSASYEQQLHVDSIVSRLSEKIKPSGFELIITETHLRHRRSNYKNFVSCNNHFQIHCLPIPEKYLEKARMHFKQALLTDSVEWSLNRKLIKIDDGRKVNKHLPKGLSYIWICFGSLDNGFAQIIEDEREFNPNYALDILRNLILKEQTNINIDFRKEPHKSQIERVNKLRSLYEGNARGLE